MNDWKEKQGEKKSQEYKPAKQEPKIASELSLERLRQICVYTKQDPFEILELQMRARGTFL